MHPTFLALDPLKLDRDPKVTGIDRWSDCTNADGTIKKELFTPARIHLSLAGHAVYAERLKPLFDKFIGGKGLGGAVVLPKYSSPTASATPARKKAE